MQILNRVPKSVKIKEIIVENDMVKTFVVDFSLGARPGQFVMLWIPRLDEKPISVAMDNGSEMHFTVAAVGPFSNAMHELSVGDFVGVRGPFGTEFECDEGAHIALLAGGYGAAPLYFFAHEAVKKGAKVEFIVGARSADLVLYEERISALDCATVHVSTDDGSKGHHGYNTQVLQELLDAGGIEAVYAVGPEIMMLKGAEAAEAAGAKAFVSVERYMKCGFGVCGNCVVDGTGDPVCLKGPVMPWEEVKKIEDFGKYHRDEFGKKHNF
ncbi:dihydroorotate dehydrogenase electron transfer subunit [Candidatus Peregrinibacteria bacterium]|jgi:dihydroorotate dehydrogenase electron transfer subunit|nr:dihydroorotate dehydrogenase electron transfer subunit [Candidatus Peregrinibacteria bacterium]MBT4631664.1 dihydroorotate dehydrogenase electron transfer subunit [Candidatus Peregrinibacteria bacterium]MBT5516792.1 dihydroorotate dehydrogenase electron transfer subunit [Candidatus Peregrinibacteria bacterium]MBT5823926.1 dihydroorotate dehydrogenase electron transfer subunit [Candidatus Peregrinibacteria bacterium]